MMLTYIILFGLAGSVGAVLGAAILILLGKRVTAIIPYILSYAIGTLLSAALLRMLPKAMATLHPATTMQYLLAGLLLFFLLEKIVIWRHCHDPHCDAHSASGVLILIGDAFHNFTDGIVIATAFMVSIPFGIAISLAIIAHEIPQEIGDFAILLDADFPTGRAVVYNLCSALPTLPGAVMAYYSLAHVQQFIPCILVLSASSFLYIALVDLMPTTHKYASWQASVVQCILILAGIGTILLLAPKASPTL
jgi:zinc and cadmium transporter